jgi:hypothetical protein
MKAKIYKLNFTIRLETEDKRDVSNPERQTRRDRTAVRERTRQIN